MNADFHRIVLEVFGDIIADHRFKVDDSSWWLIELVNDACIVRLIYDSGFVVAQFVSPKEKAERQAVKRPDGFPSGYPMYSVFSVWRKLYPNDKENYRYKGDDMEGEVRAIRRLILERLTRVLDGDFSWVEGL